MFKQWCGLSGQQCIASYVVSHCGLGGTCEDHYECLHDDHHGPGVCSAAQGNAQPVAYASTLVFLLFVCFATVDYG